MVVGFKLSQITVDGLMLELKDDDDWMILSLSEAVSSKEQRFDQNQRERHN